MSYKLPFPKGKQVWCTQGNNNTAEGSSHRPNTKAAYALDFSLAPGDNDEGELIVAAAGGTVTMIKEDTPNHVTREAGLGQGNYLVIRHNDGFCDLYMHLMYGCVSEFGLVVGSQVVQGQPVARLGKTGFCFGAHLHFQRQHCGASYWEQSVPVTFDDVGGTPRMVIMYVSGNEAVPQPVVQLEDVLDDITAQRTAVVLEPARALLAAAAQSGLGASLSGISRVPDPKNVQHYVQVFEKDALYLSTAVPAQVGNVGSMRNLLTANAADAWGLALWKHTYTSAGVEYRSYWSSHQYVLAQLAGKPLGAPLGGGTTNGVYPEIIGVKRYEAEVYAEDTIYWVVNEWGDIHRLSDLGQPGELRTWLEGITSQQADKLLKPARAFLAVAQAQNAGAPLSGISRINHPNGRPYFVQVFEADTLYLHADPPINQSHVGSMRTLLVATPNDPWGLILWKHTYANAGLQFHSGWSSHQYVQGQLAQNPLGAPLGGDGSNGVYMRTIGGQAYEIEVYARDTIYWLPPAWGTIHRRSQL
jgi:hypothetical protein